MTKPSPATMPQPAKVEALAGFGLTPLEIAVALDVDVELLQQTCARELKSGHIKANARVAESLYRKATGDGKEAVTAAIFWLKTRARWKETTVQELSGDLVRNVTVTIVDPAEEFTRKEANPADSTSQSAKVSLLTGVPRTATGRDD